MAAKKFLRFQLWCHLAVKNNFLGICNGGKSIHFFSLNYNYFKTKKVVFNMNKILNFNLKALQKIFSEVIRGAQYYIYYLYKDSNVYCKRYQYKNYFCL